MGKGVYFFFSIHVNLDIIQFFLLVKKQQKEY